MNPLIHIKGFICNARIQQDNLCKFIKIKGKQGERHDGRKSGEKRSGNGPFGEGRIKKYKNQ